jgi:hypothetical protein
MSVDYKQYTDESFENAEAFQAFLREGNHLKYDYVIVDGILYTMHEYDMAGKSVTWANLKHRKLMEVITSDRYNNGYKDAEVEIYDYEFFRNDINYAE